MGVKQRDRLLRRETSGLFRETGAYLGSILLNEVCSFVLKDSTETRLAP
jgi:hypothetical protein